MKYFKYLKTSPKIFICLIGDGTRIKKRRGIKKNDSKKLKLPRWILAPKASPLYKYTEKKYEKEV